MKKTLPIIVILIGLFFVGRGVQISHKLYISSIYLNYEKDSKEYELVLFSPSSVSVGKTEGDSNATDAVIKSKASSIEDAFNQAERSTDYEINLRQAVSIVLHTNFLNEQPLDSLKQFVLNSDYIDMNFYLFTTEEKGEDIFTFSNPDNNSNYYSILTITKGSMYLFNFVSPLYFVEFLRLYNKPETTIRIPKVSLAEDFVAEEESKNIKLSGVCVYNKEKIETYDVDEDLFLVFLNNFSEGKYYLAEYPIIINRVDISYKRKEKLTVNIKITYKNLVGVLDTNELEEYIQSGVEELIERMYSNGIDYFFLSDINAKYNKKYGKDDIEIKLKLRNN